ncbi:hypothetical protein [Conexibacter arvalis]|uniref:Uncharacterized protein n=1 Tax=Conexibacter arvalis TaxID=912552 RepID=A0A840IDI3_9ACTN|nr:hypothetical protein [Conexibacter arvalis]MBB4662311.1 hypothetical protein [Conexibacter arvalis]
MTTKAAFNAEDWSVVTAAPALTGLLVAAAGRGGTVRESVAISRAYADAREGRPGQLLREVLETPAGVGPAPQQRTTEDLERYVLARVRAAIRVLDLGATPEEVAEYKRFVYGVGEAVAHAHKEGGFLGVGGERVSEDEQAVLDKVAAIFDEPPTVAPGEEAPAGDRPADDPPGIA